MITLLLLMTIAMFWSSVSIGGRFILWIFRWSLILTLLAWVVIPASVNIIGAICLASLVAWAVSVIRKTITTSTRHQSRMDPIEDTVFFDVTPAE